MQRPTSRPAQRSAACWIVFLTLFTFSPRPLIARGSTGMKFKTERLIDESVIDDLARRFLQKTNGDGGT
jgi:hypothetical protein